MHHKTIKLTFLGDVMCTQRQLCALKRAKCGWDRVFERVKHLWADSDYVVANLETPAAGKKYRLTYETMRFNAPLEMLAAMKSAGIDFVSTANNHALDRGVRGLEATIRNLDAVGLEHSGAYLSKEDSERIFVKGIGGLRVAFVVCTYGTNQGLKCGYLPDADLWRVDILKYPEIVKSSRWFHVRRFLSNCVPLPVKDALRRNRAPRAVTPELDSVPECEIGKPEHKPFEMRIRDKVRRAKSISDVTVSLPHVGGQYHPMPGAFQMRTINWMLKEGADIVVANHAHIPQNTLKNINYNEGGGYACCALGDFVSYPPKNCIIPEASRYSAMISFVVDCGTAAIINTECHILKTVLDKDGVAVVVEAKEDGCGIRDLFGFPVVENDLLT